MCFVYIFCTNIETRHALELYFAIISHTLARRAVFSCIHVVQILRVVSFFSQDDSITSQAEEHMPIPDLQV